MNFICEPCKIGADLKTESIIPIVLLKKQWHSKCKGNTHCDCRHRTTK